MFLYLLSTRQPWTRACAFPMQPSNRMRGGRPALGFLNFISLFFFFHFFFLISLSKIRACTLLGKNTGNLKDLKSLLYFHHPKVTTFNNLVPILLERSVQGERYRERKNFTCVSHFLGISPKQKHQALLWPGQNPLYLCHTWIACSSILEQVVQSSTALPTDPHPL